MKQQKIILQCKKCGFRYYILIEDYEKDKINTTYNCVRLKKNKQGRGSNICYGTLEEVKND